MQGTLREEIVAGGNFEEVAGSDHFRLEIGPC